MVLEKKPLPKEKHLLLTLSFLLNYSFFKSIIFEIAPKQQLEKKNE
jgi:hypothetical protein